MRAAPSTRIYATSIVHARTTPVQHRFRHRSHTWLVDLDDLPRPRGRCARSPASSPATTSARRTARLRENLDTFLATQGIDLDGGRILMLAMPRVLGTVFNPISVYWCHTPTAGWPATSSRCTTPTATGTPTSCTPTTQGRAEVDKALYVSPFNDVSGRYRLTIPTPGDTVQRPGRPRAPRPGPVRGRHCADAPCPCGPAPSCASPSPSPSNPSPSPRASAGTAYVCGCAASRCSHARPTTRRQSSDHRHRRPVHQARPSTPAAGPT